MTTTTQPTRNLSVLVVVVVIATALISATILSSSTFEKTVTSTTTTTSTSVSTLSITSTIVRTSTVTAGCVGGVSQITTTVNPDYSNSTTDCSIWITLGINGSLGVAPGEGQSVTLSLTNDLPISRGINFTSTPREIGSLNLSSPQSVDFVLTGSQPPPCTPNAPQAFPALFPAFIAMFNDSSGAPVQLTDIPPQSVTCLQPFDQGQSSDNYAFNASQSQTLTLTIPGYWTSANASAPWIAASFHPGLPVGTYTIVAFDSWRQIVELRFFVNILS